MLEIFVCIVLFTLGNTLLYRRNNKEEMTVSESVSVPVPIPAPIPVPIPVPMSEPLQQNLVKSDSYIKTPNPSGYDSVNKPVTWEDNFSINIQYDPQFKDPNINMVPYARKFTQNTNYKQRHSEEALKMMGIDPYWKSKKETNKFFKPKKNMAFVNGSPNTLEEQITRYVSPTKKHNHLPFTQCKENNAGSKSPIRDLNFGYNNLENRIHRPNVDELRTLSNPKLSYEISELAGALSAVVKNRGKIGKVEVTKKIEELLIHYVGTGYSANMKHIIKPLISKYMSYIRSQQLNKFDVGTAYKPTKQVIVNLIKETVQFKKKLLMINAVLNLVGDIKHQKYNREINHKKVGSYNDTIDYNRNLLGNIREILPFIDEAITTIREQTENNNRNGNIGGLFSTYTELMDEIRTTIKETTENNKHTGNLTGTTKHILGLMDELKTTLKEILVQEFTKLNLTSQTKKPQVYNKQPARTTIRELIEETNRAGNLSTIDKIGAYIVQLYNIDLIKTNREDYSEDQVASLLKGIVGASHNLKQKKMDAEVTTIGDKILVEDRVWTYHGSKKAPIVEDVSLTVEKIMDSYDQLEFTTLKQYNSNNTPKLGEVTVDAPKYTNINGEILEGSINSVLSQLDNNPYAQTSLHKL
jgi:hypothetical protein